MNPVGRNHPCSAKEQDKDAIARGKARHDLKSPGKRSEKSQKIHGKDRKSPGKDLIKQRLQKQYLYKKRKQDII